MDNNLLCGGMDVEEEEVRASKIDKGEANGRRGVKPGRAGEPGSDVQLPVIRSITYNCTDIDRFD